MSASPNNAGLELITEPITPSAPAPLEAVPEPARPSREALQALLAFSALQEQIRQRREQEKRRGAGFSVADVWQLEQFVLDEVLQLVAERALVITGADGVAIALAEGDAIVCRASAGIIAPDAGARLDPDAGFSGACLVSRQVVRCDDAETDPRVDVLACRRLGARSMVAVPLSVKQNVIGLVEAFSTEPYGLNDSDVRSLTLLGELILSAMKPEEEDRLAEISRRVVAKPGLATISDETRTATDVTEPIPAEREAEPESAEPDSRPAPLSEYEAVEKSRPGLGVVVAVVLFAVGLGGGLWWSIRENARTAPVTQPAATAMAPTPETGTPPLTQATVPTPIPVSAPPAQDDTPQESTAPADAGVLPLVSGVRHWASDDASTVVIDLQDQVQYEAHRLTNPERIYFDLHDTRLADALANKIIDVQDVLLQRIRIAQPFPGVTRVVLETKSASDFSVSLESNPYRLVVEIRKPGSKPHERAKIDLFAPENHSASAEPRRAAQDKGMVSAPPASGVAAYPSVPKLRIVLDAGHGGWDLGTVGRGGLLEKDVVLDVAERVGRLIQSRLGAEVIFTRNGDDYLALEKRAEIANLAHADLFLSIHANYSDYASARGVETYYTNTYSSIRARPRAEDEGPSLQNVNWTNVDIREKVHDSHLLAVSVQRSLYNVLAAKNPGLRNRGVKEAQYVVLTGTSMPAILAEISFLSSSDDENNLQSAAYRQKIADAVYQGVAHYAEEKSKPEKLAKVMGKTAAR